MTFDRVLNGLLKFVLPVVVIAELALGIIAVLNQLTLDRQSAERRALTERAAQLSAIALAPGSALSCLDGGAGDTAETACEAALFASPQSTAAAVTYVGAKLTLLADVRDYDPEGGGRPLVSRRALELDRFGIVGHVLATRDACTPDACAAFALFADANAIRANMKAQAFDQYVSRHVAAWNAPAGTPAPSLPEMSKAPDAALPAAADAKTPEAAGHPVSSKYTFPSSASIPPVSIMNTEPPRPKEPAASGAPAAAAPDDAPPMPPRRPQAQREPAETAVAR
jgi:hypothetical protein